MLIQAVLEANKKASEMAGIIKLYPQVLVNAKVNSEKKYDYDKYLKTIRGVGYMLTD